MARNLLTSSGRANTFSATPPNAARPSLVRSISRASSSGVPQLHIGLGLDRDARDVGRRNLLHQLGDPLADLLPVLVVLVLPQEAGHDGPLQLGERVDLDGDGTLVGVIA